MKTSVLICAAREEILLLLTVMELYCQGVSPGMLHFEAMDSRTVRIRLEIECDEWVLCRLRMQWDKISGVQAVVATRPDGTEIPVTAARFAASGPGAVGDDGTECARPPHAPDGGAAVASFADRPVPVHGVS